MAVETICQHCNKGTIYNTGGYPDWPSRRQCDQCWGNGYFVTFTHEECGNDTTVPGGRIEGCTFDCACGKIMLIEKGEAIDLYGRMAANLREQYGLDVNPQEGFGYIEL